MTPSNFTGQFELIDCGDGRRLEQFGSAVIDRPAPSATWSTRLPPSTWDSSVSAFDPKQKWSRTIEPFPIQLGSLTLEMRLSENGQVGLFPEQLNNWQWIHDQLTTIDRPVSILNAFAYTGVATLAASAASEHVSMCHVDGAKSAISWARHNAELSGLSDRPIRWIHDDTLTFLRKEVKRGRRYDGFILDPPAFGRGPGGDWKLERDLPELIDLVKQLLSDSPCFVVLSCHAPELTTQDLARYLESLEALPDIEELELIIPSENGNNLPSSICARGRV